MPRVKLKLKLKLLLSFLAIASLVVLVSGIAMHASQRVYYSAGEMAMDIAPALNHLGSLKSAATRLSEGLFGYGVSVTSSKRQTSGASKVMRVEILMAKEGFQDARQLYQVFLDQQIREQPYSGEIKEQSDNLARIADDFFRRLEAGSSEQEMLKMRRGLRSVEDRLIAVIDFASNGYVASLQERQFALGEMVEQSARFSYLAIAAVLLFACLLALLLAERIAEPILALKDAALSLGKGNLQVRVEPTSADEIGELASGFNAMAENLQNTTVSKSFVENIISSMSSSLIVLDEKLEISKVNQATLELLNYKETELLGEPYTVVLGETEKLDLNSFEDTLSSNVEREYVQSDGGRVSVVLSISILKNSSGEAEGMVLVARDITERKKVRAELSKYRERLIQSEQMASLGTMTGMLMHKLNQPLTSMRLFLQQSLRALEGSSLDGVDDNLRECLEAVARMSEAVKELLSYTRRPRPEKTDQINLSKIASKTMQILRESAEQENIELRVNGLDKLPVIEGIQEEIEEIFFILVQNAIQAAPGDKASELMISGSLKDQEVEVVFSDSCLGIALEYMDKVFDPFFTTKPLGKGTGLGLAICQQLVTNHSGELRLESIPGKGSNFYFTLPLTQEELTWVQEQ